MEKGIMETENEIWQGLTLICASLWWGEDWDVLDEEQNEYWDSF